MSLCLHPGVPVGVREADVVKHVLHVAGCVLVFSSESIAPVPIALCVRVGGELMCGEYREPGGGVGLSRGAGAGGQRVDGAEECPQWLSEAVLGET